MNLEFFVSHDRVTYSGASADSSACDSFTVAFDSRWDELVKVVVLKNGSATAQVIYTGKTPLPRQVCGRGDLYLSCYGYRQLGDSVAVMQTKPMVRPVRMQGRTEPEGDSAQPWAPSLLEQLTAAAGTAQRAAQKAEEVCATLTRLHEQGAFRGEQGPAGQAATVQVESVRHGETAQVENVGTARNALLRFTLPYKLTEQERQQLLGDIDTALDHILAIQNAILGGDGT